MMSEELKCAAFGKCGGCSLLNVKYSDQLALKQKNMEKLLSGFAKVEPVIGMEDPLYYRNKVHHSFGYGKKGGVISGSYAANSHRILTTEECFLEDSICQEIIRSIRELAESFGIEIFNEDRGRGILRHALIRRGFTSKEVMVVLVTGSDFFPSRSNFAKELVRRHPEITTVVQNINGKKTGMVLGEMNRTIYGPGFIRDTICGLTFRISPTSFYQVNPVQTEVLYRKAVEFAELSGRETVIDAYCGIGTIGLCAAKKAGRVIGVELNKNAVADAVLNCKENGIKNARFYQGDATRFISSMAMKGERAGVVFMDPPRSGSTPQFIDSVCRMKPERVVYVSCGPETLARDLRIFESKSYRVSRIQPVDMFPYTREHVETVVQLVRKAPEANKRAEKGNK